MSSYIKVMDENGQPYGVKHIANKLRVSSMPYTYDIAEGVVADHAAFRRFGRNSTVGTAWETICNTNAEHVYLAAAEQLKVVSSDADDDGDPADTGARTMLLQGLDGDYAVISETITLNGTTAVTTTKSFLRPLQARVLTVGSSGFNEGTISIKNNAETSTLIQIDIGEGESNAAIWTVPAGYTAYITSWNGAESSNKGSEIGLWWREFGKSWLLKRDYTLITDTFYHPFMMPLPVPAKTDIALRAKGVLAGAFVTAGFEGWYEVA